MTPKEKAIELYSKFYNRIEHTLSEEYSPHEKYIITQCALIAVDEVINFIDNRMQGWVNIDWMVYWDNVKKEIEKL